ncbi:UvrD-helicase domain-containing protein [Legionella cherrii]|uniref:DNA 3'-5' helicase II n=1 Tax=Legionella cherrii TaxID=28084 RepID=A0ABY6T5T2_9GAMM|nr:UvrD-helicase domain-containing protein [Legionella cherrii]VEB36505.1 DNA-dependent helicase II [Legionella cherrii]
MDEPDYSMCVDEEIYNCLNLDNPKSFFLFAGAGSGKTRSLVEVLKKFREKNIQRLQLQRQKIAIITYTNAACDEIKRRLDFDPSFSISTIHSFAWELIKPYQSDIKEWLKNNLKSEIAELNEAQGKGRPGSKTSEDRSRKINSKLDRINSLESIKKFIYNPNGDNNSKDSLNHTEVISITVDFLMTHSLMRKILVRTFPILLIDESQDTKKELIDAFFEIQKMHSDIFSLGLFGDTMQRIYTDGKSNLGQNIPISWAKPEKKINYRCPKRIIKLINQIRSAVDAQVQESAKSEYGFVRLFIADTKKDLDKTAFEFRVSEKMAEITGDTNWKELSNEVKILTIEHHMAAKRGGFSDFFNPLYEIDQFKTGVLDGTLQGISLFSNQILPLINALRANDKFQVSRIVKKYSPLLSKEVIKKSLTPREKIITANAAVQKLYDLWNEGNSPSLIQILNEIYQSDLFQIPNIYMPIAARLKTQENMQTISLENHSDEDKIINAWDNALKSSFIQFEAYFNYISDNSRFGTHQGIKGLEFPRVMVILDDEESRGFLFSYEKLFCAKELTEADKKNIQEGKETTVDRTIRLFYVTCSRAEESLAIIAYSKDPIKVKSHAISQGWFDENEIIDNLQEC